jgi:hypothetical protein
MVVHRDSDLLGQPGLGERCGHGRASEGVCAVSKNAANCDGSHVEGLSLGKLISLRCWSWSATKESNTCHPQLSWQSPLWPQFDVIGLVTTTVVLHRHSKSITSDQPMQQCWEKILSV